MNDMGRELEAALQRRVAPPAQRLSLDEGKVKSGLGQLVLTLVKLLHELLEKQAIRRMEGGTLSDDEMERLGMALLRQAEEIERKAVEMGMDFWRRDPNLSSLAQREPPQALPQRTAPASFEEGALTTPARTP